MSCTNVKGYIREDQDALTITLDTCLDITTGVQSVQIAYRDPLGVTGAWTASVVNTTEISYTLADNEFLTPKGTWHFKAVVNFADGTRASGTTVSEIVHGSWDIF